MRVYGELARKNPTAIAAASGRPAAPGRLRGATWDGLRALPVASRPSEGVLSLHPCKGDGIVNARPSSLPFPFPVAVPRMLSPLGVSAVQGSGCRGRVPPTLLAGFP